VGLRVVVSARWANLHFLGELGLFALNFDFLLVVRELTFLDGFLSVGAEKKILIRSYRIVSDFGFCGLDFLSGFQESSADPAETEPNLQNPPKSPKLAQTRKKITNVKKNRVRDRKKIFCLTVQ